MANINRDYLATLNVKTSEITLDRQMVFYTTDKQTMNVYVKLVIDMSTNPYIKEYVALENASNYKVGLVLIAPNNETFYIDGDLVNEEQSLFMYNLTNDYIDKVGEWTCEFRVYSTVNTKDDEIVTSNRFSYTVKGSITHDLDDEVFDTEDINLISNLTERVAKLEEGNIDVDIDLTGYATEEYVDDAIKSVDVTDQLKDYAKKTDIPTVPTNVSAFTNDKGYLTSIPSEYVTDSELNAKGYLTQHQDLSAYAKTSQIPTKVSQLTNDKNYLTSIPSEYVTDSELTAKGYLTSIPSEYVTDSELNGKGYATQSYVSSEIAKAQLDGGDVDLSGYATKDDLHSHSNKSVIDGITSAKVTSWDNKSTFSGNYNDLTNKPTIPTVTNDLTNTLKSNYDKAYTHSNSTHAPTNAQKNSDITKAEIEAKLTGSITSHTHNYLSSVPSEYVTDTELTNKGYATKEYVDTSVYTKLAYGTCSTEAGTSEKAVVVDDDDWKLEVGSMVAIKYSVTNSASNVKINVNNTGAYPIWYSTEEYTSTGGGYCGYANRILTYVFNGTHWVWVSGGYQPSYSNASLGQGYGVCSTAESTTAKACTISSYSLSTGGIVAIKFTYGVPANATLNIRTRGAKKIFYKGSAITTGVIKAGDIATFIYDGTQYQLISIDRDYSSEITALRNELLGEINNIATLLGGDA